MSGVVLKDIKKSYGAINVIHGVNLEVDKGEFIVFVGPSGCGKSTLLRMIAGLEEISAGEMFIDGEQVNDTPPSKRGIAMVFQSYALYPHMTVYDNMAFGMRIAKQAADEIDKRVRAAADILQLGPYLERLPKALSGGQRQRVAIGRAIVREPAAFLFDEPLSNLDAELRVQMRVELSKLHADLGTTMIYVTHDQVEAMTMANRIVVLRDGLIEQAGTPLELYNHPANQFVAGFIGSPKMNFLQGSVASHDASGVSVRLNGGETVALSVATAPAAGSPITLGIRPEHVELATGGVPMKVALTEQLGGNTVLYGNLSDQQSLVVQVVGQSLIKRGDTVHVALPQASCHAFGTDGKTLPKRAA
jgi:ABC-type sugar transport system ATPase subunit